LKVSDLSESDLRGLLRQGNLLLQISPFVARIRSDVHKVAHEIALMYGDFTVCQPEVFADFHVEVAREAGLRRWVSPLARFAFDGKRSFVPLPAAQAFPMIEWGLNWCVAAHAHQYLVIHAAVIEKGGRAAVLPAPPGSGKSTLCAGLVNRGWRLLSDELALYDLATGLIHGMARPVNLKNASIDVIRAFAPEAVFTVPVPDTTKGTVALMRPSSGSVLRAQEPVRPAWIILPKYEANAEAVLSVHGKAETFMLVAEQSFNYDIHGLRGFNAVADLLDQCASHTFTYGHLDDAVRVFERLAAEPAS